MNDSEIVVPVTEGAHAPAKSGTPVMRSMNADEVAQTVNMIAGYLKNNPDSGASTVARALGLRRKTVNSVLYGSRTNFSARGDSPPLWRLVASPQIQEELTQVVQTKPSEAEGLFAVADLIDLALESGGPQSIDELCDSTGLATDVIRPIVFRLRRFERTEEDPQRWRRASS